MADFGKIYLPRPHKKKKKKKSKKESKKKEKSSLVIVCFCAYQLIKRREFVILWILSFLWITLMVGSLGFMVYQPLSVI